MCSRRQVLQTAVRDSVQAPHLGLPLPLRAGRRGVLRGGEHRGGGQVDREFQLNVILELGTNLRED